MNRKESTKEAIAGRIKDAMARRGMTRKQLADAVGRRPSEVTKWLSGKHNFTVDLLTEISDAVGARIIGGSAYGNQYAIGPVMVPGDVFHALEYKTRYDGPNTGFFAALASIKGMDQAWGGEKSSAEYLAQLREDEEEKEILDELL